MRLLSASWQSVQEGLSDGSWIRDSVVGCHVSCTTEWFSFLASQTLLADKPSVLSQSPTSVHWSTATISGSVPLWVQPVYVTVWPT